MHAMHNEALVEGKDFALVFSNAKNSARLLDFFEKQKIRSTWKERLLLMGQK
jgi:hypothetical protein